MTILLLNIAWSVLNLGFLVFLMQVHDGLAKGEKQMREREHITPPG